MSDMGASQVVRMSTRILPSHIQVN